MKKFWAALPRSRRGAVIELYLVYFVLGIGVILLGSVLPDIRAVNDLNYQQGGNLLSIQSIGFLLIGLVTGFLMLKLGIKRAYLLTYLGLPIGFVMLIIGGGYGWLSLAMLLIGLTKGSITDYNNRVMSDYAHGEAAPMNMLHVFFAIGACIAPMIALFCSGLSSDGWRISLVITAVLAAAIFLYGLFTKMDIGSGQTPDKTAASGSTKKNSYGFFGIRIFWQTLVLGICDQALEATLMGWLTTFFLDSGYVSDSTAAMVTSLLWISFLIGRLACSAMAAKLRPWQLLLIMGIGTAFFSVLLVASGNAVMLILSTIGVGLCLSGMYGTSVSNAGSLFSDYPQAMGLYVTIAGIGGAAAPAAIGSIANVSDMRHGFFVFTAVAFVLAIGVIVNALYFVRAQKQDRRSTGSAS